MKLNYNRLTKLLGFELMKPQSVDKHLICAKRRECGEVGGWTLLGQSLLQRSPQEQVFPGLCLLWGRCNACDKAAQGMERARVERQEARFLNLPVVYDSVQILGA